MGLSTVTQFIRRTLDSLRIPEVQIAPTVDAAPITAEHYAPPGVDAVPLAGDTAVQVPGTGRGRAAVVGYMDTANEGAAQPGEVRFYARDSDGVPVCTVWLQGDGSVALDAGGGAMVTIQSDGKVIIDADAVEIAGATDQAALASRVQALETWANAHIHTTTATIGSSATVGVISAPTVPSNNGPFGSDVLKVGS